MVPQALSLGVKRPRREADHSPPSSVEVKNAWSGDRDPPNMKRFICFIFISEVVQKNGTGGTKICIKMNGKMGHIGGKAVQW
jgi:hypothetical protein